MTNFTKNMMIAAAAMTIAAGVAGAQTIKAEVPFGFRAAGTAMPAGTYVVKADYLSGGNLAVTLTNQDTHRSMITMPYAHSNRKPAEASASLTFECSGTDCTLVQVVPGGESTYRIWKPKSENDGNTRVAVIRAVLVNAR